MEWITFGTSVIGASHIKKETPNQDAINFGDLPPFVAVSDGHGGKKYIRSEIGSRLAVLAIEQVLKESLPLHADLSDINEHIRHIKSRFLLHWQNSVDNQLEQEPFTQEEYIFLNENCSENDRIGLENNPRLAFGCTFLAGIVYEDIILILQHGDGDIVALHRESTIDVMETDGRNFAGSTLSLGSLKDANQITHRVISGDDIPELITISTDGIKNSYDDTDSDSISQFYKIPVVIKNAIDSGRDIQEITADLDSLLERITTNGSGDDVTLGIIVKA